MTNSTSNPFVEYYEKNNISPVKQNISNLKEHLIRRERLYRTLGIPVVTFRDKKVLEIGPGGGYNSVAFFYWGASVDFVEPNTTAQVELPELLKSYKIGKEKWKLNKCFIEEYRSEHKFDLIFAEGFMAGTSISDRKNIINKISDILNPGGVVVSTCIDEVSYFFENIRKFLSLYITKEEEDFSKKVNMLCEAFKSHFYSLSSATRPLEDFIMDQLLNPALSENLFSLEDCINEFGLEYQPINSSPSAFNDNVWYKNLDVDMRSNFITQYNMKKHMMLHYEVSDEKRDINKNNQLHELCKELHSITKLCEDNFDDKYIEIFSSKLEIVRKNIKDIDRKGSVTRAIDEAILLLDKSLKIEDIASCKYFSKAFGHCQQYISLSKNFTK